MVMRTGWLLATITRHRAFTWCGATIAGVVDPVEALAAEPQRTIAFDAVFNFRDLGGYPASDGRSVRWRRLFRADGLHRLRAAEGEQFRALGIRTVIDLRTKEEVQERGRFPTEVAEVDHHHLPMFDVEPDWRLGDAEAPGYLADRYVEMLEAGRRTVASSLALLARPEAYPLVFHCAVGKDRTGILAAVVLGLLGVPDEVIAEDYAISHEAMVRMNAWLIDTQPDLALDPGRYPASVFEARPATMTRFLEHLRNTHGSVEGLVRDLGVGGETVEGIRANLVGHGHGSGQRS